MLAVVEAVLSVQQSSVQQLPRLAEVQPAQRVSDDELVAPLPFGPNEQRHFRADGGREMATAEEVEAEPGAADAPT